MHSTLGRIVLLTSTSALLCIGACKAKDEAETGNAAITPPAKPEPAQPTPAPIPDAQGPAVIGEQPHVLLDSKGANEGQWTVTDTNIRFRAEFAEGTDEADKRDASVFATIGETPEAEVFKCQGMLMAGEPRVEALLRGDHMHILCINPPAGENPGFTDAKRVTFDAAKMALTETGSYGGEGIVDPDSIDLDEGEGEGE